MFVTSSALRNDDEVKAFMLVGQNEWVHHWKRNEKYVIQIVPCFVLLNDFTSFGDKGDVQHRFESVGKPSFFTLYSYFEGVHRKLSELASLVEILVVKEQPTLSEVRGETAFLSCLLGRNTKASATETSLYAALMGLLSTTHAGKSFETSDTEGTFRLRHQSLLHLFFDATRCKSWVESALGVIIQGSDLIHDIDSSTSTVASRTKSLHYRASHDKELELAEQALSRFDESSNASQIEGLVLVARTYFHGLSSKMYATGDDVAHADEAALAARVKFDRWCNRAELDLALLTDALPGTLDDIVLRWVEIERHRASSQVEQDEAVLATLKRSKQRWLGLEASSKNYDQLTPPSSETVSISRTEEGHETEDRSMMFRRMMSEPSSEAQASRVFL